MNDYRVYTYSEKGGYNQFLYGADSLFQAVVYHNETHPDDEIICIEKITYLSR